MKTENGEDFIQSLSLNRWMTSCSLLIVIDPPELAFPCAYINATIAQV
jgi:hypothetical protein